MRGASPSDAGEVLGKRLVALMHNTRIPNGLSGLGYDASDLEALTHGAFPQQRLLQNAPLPVDEATLKSLFSGAIHYW